MAQTLAQKTVPQWRILLLGMGLGLVTALASLVVGGALFPAGCAEAAGGCPVGERAEFTGDLSLRSGTIYTVTLQHDASADRVVSLPNASGTLVLDGRQVATGTGLDGGGDLSADRTLAVTASYRLPQTCSDTEVAAWDAASSTWTCTATGGSALADAYTALTDGSATAVAVGGDTFRLRGQDALGVTVANDDATYGDNALFQLTTSPASAAALVGTGRTLSGGTGIDAIGDLSADRTIAVTASYRLPQTCNDAEVAEWDAASSTWVCTATGGTSLADAYALITDGTTTASASGSDTFRLRGSGALGVTVANDDATYGDNALFQLTTSPASAAALVGTGRTLTGGTGIDALGDLSADRTIAVTASYRLPQTCTDAEVAEWDAASSTWVCTAIGGGGYATIEDEGTALTQRDTLNFTGGGITCSDDSTNAETDCDVPGASGGGWELLGKQVNTSCGYGMSLSGLPFGTYTYYKIEVLVYSVCSTQKTTFSPSHAYTISVDGGAPAEGTGAAPLTNILPSSTTIREYATFECINRGTLSGVFSSYCTWQSGSWQSGNVVTQAEGWLRTGNTLNTITVNCWCDAGSRLVVYGLKE